MTDYQEANEEGFIWAAAAAEVEEGRITTVTLNQTPVILTKVNGVIHAFSARCPHASGDLTQGDLHRGRINCPDHDYRFDIRTGYPVWPEDEVCRLKKYLIFNKNGQILIKV